MKTIKKNPFELSVMDSPSYDKEYIYLTIRIDTRKDPRVIKPGDSPGGLYSLKYKERIEKNLEGHLLLVDGDMSWFSRMGYYDIKDIGKNEQLYKERRLSYIDFHKEEEEINRLLRYYLVDVFTVTYSMDD